MKVVTKEKAMKTLLRKIQREQARIARKTSSMNFEISMSNRVFRDALDGKWYHKVYIDVAITHRDHKFYFNFDEYQNPSERNNVLKELYDKIDEIYPKKRNDRTELHKPAERSGAGGGSAERGATGD